MADKTKIGDRMKAYEQVSQKKLMKGVPVIMRFDGVGFSKFTKGLHRPMDSLLHACMVETTKELCANIQGAKIGYTQSDEITLLIIDYDKLTTDGWFDYKTSKMESVGASMATRAFNKAFRRFYDEECAKENPDVVYLNTLSQKLDKAIFDARAQNIPPFEVVNNFIWRQQDATRNSILSLGFAHFPNESLNGLNTSEIQDKLMLEKGINWNDCPVIQKRGTCVTRATYMKEDTQRSHWVSDYGIPIFTQDREYIEQFVYIGLLA